MEEPCGAITDIVDAEKNPEIISLAQFAVNEYNKKQNALLQFEYVVKAKQQIVAGVAYYIALVAKDGDVNNIYEAKVWDKIGKNSKELLEFKPILDTSIGINESIGVETSPYIDSLARFAVDEYNKLQNVRRLQFEKVIKAKKQIVDGVIYDITLEAIDDGEKKICVAKVWVKPWQNFKKLLEFMLVNGVGGINESTGVENSPDFDSLARFAVDEYNKKNAKLQFEKVTETKEIVESVIYDITLEAIDDGKMKNCKVKVWVNPWQNFKELLDFKFLADATSAS